MNTAMPNQAIPSDLPRLPGGRTLASEKFKVVLLCLFAACLYGVIHDQITARLCIEYFTVAHPPLFHTTSPTLLALCWGVAATSGIGAAFGVVLALVSQSGARPPYQISRLCRSIMLLLGLMASSAVIAGIVGYQLAHQGFISMPLALSQLVPVQQHDRFMAVWFAHGASYLVGLAGGAVLCFRVWRARGRPSAISLFPHTPVGTFRAVLLVAFVAYIIWIRFSHH